MMMVLYGSIVIFSFVIIGTVTNINVIVFVVLLLVSLCLNNYCNFCILVVHFVILIINTQIIQTIVVLTMKKICI